MATKQVEDAKIDMTPMIDIVFQMIIFFVVTIELDRQVIDQRIELADSPAGPAVEKRDPRTINVDVDRRGNISIARTRIDENTLRAMLSQARGIYGPEVPVHIRGDRRTAHSHIRRVLNAAGESGLYRISIIALKEHGEQLP